MVEILLKEEDFVIDLNLFLRNALYFSKPPKDSKNDSQFFHGEGRLNFGKKFDVEEGSSITAAGWLELGNRKNVYGEWSDNFDYRDEKRNRWRVSGPG